VRSRVKSKWEASHRNPICYNIAPSSGKSEEKTKTAKEKQKRIWRGSKSKKKKRKEKLDFHEGGFQTSTVTSSHKSAQVDNTARKRDMSTAPE